MTCLSVDWRHALRRAVACLLLAGVALLPGCSDDDDDPATPPGPDYGTADHFDGVTAPAAENLKQVGEATTVDLGAAYQLFALAGRAIPGGEALAPFLARQTARLTEAQANLGGAQGIKALRLDYQSVDDQGMPITLSELVVLPTVGGVVGTGVKRLLVGCHHTITDDASRPSNFSIASVNGVYALLAGPFGATDASLLVMPDYQGYGASRDRSHPYLCRQITSRQVVDGVLAALSWSREREGLTLADDWRGYAFGYSQGGAAALGVHRFIEENLLTERLHFGGSLCGDGPYAPRLTAMTYCQDKRVAMPVALALMLKGLCDCSGRLRGHETCADYLTSGFVESGVEQMLEGKEKNTTEMDQAIRACPFAADAPEGYFEPGSLMAPDVLDAFNDGVCGEGAPERLQRLFLALDDNDILGDWQPQKPAIVFHSAADEVVPYACYEAALGQLGANVRGYHVAAEQGQTHTGAMFSFVAGGGQWLDDLGSGAWKDAQRDNAVAP